MTAGKGKAIDSGRRSMPTGTTSTTKTTITNIPHCLTEAVAAETVRGTGCLLYLEIIPHREEEDGGEKRGVLHLTILRPLPHQGPSPVAKY